MQSINRVLVVSADVLLHNRLSNHLSSENYEIKVIKKANSELEEIIGETSPHIIVVDPEISQLNGVDISLRIRQVTPAPILVLTTARTLDNQLRALDLAAEDYLSEPFDVNEVVERIEHILSLNSPIVEY